MLALCLASGRKRQAKGKEDDDDEEPDGKSVASAANLCRAEMLARINSQADGEEGEDEEEEPEEEEEEEPEDE